MSSKDKHHNLSFISSYGSSLHSKRLLRFSSNHHISDWTQPEKPKPRPKQNSHAFVLPVFKDTKTGIYYTNVTVGKPSLVVNLAVDVRGSALWFQCDKLGYNSTNYTPILCGSNCCKQTKNQCLTSLHGHLRTTLQKWHLSRLPPNPNDLQHCPRFSS